MYVGSLLGITFDKFSVEKFLDGINIELEHGLINPNTNEADNGLIKTAKIVLPHLNEFSNYYNKDYGIKQFTDSLKLQLVNKKTIKVIVI